MFFPLYLFYLIFAYLFYKTHVVVGSCVVRSSQYREKILIKASYSTLVNTLSADILLVSILTITQNKIHNYCSSIFSWGTSKEDKCLQVILHCIDFMYSKSFAVASEDKHRPSRGKGNNITKIYQCMHLTHKGYLFDIW